MSDKPTPDTNGGHRWFAWYPVVLDSDPGIIVWLRIILRRWVPSGDIYHSGDGTWYYTL